MFSALHGKETRWIQAQGGVKPPEFNSRNNMPTNSNSKSNKNAKKNNKANFKNKTKGAAINTSRKMAIPRTLNSGKMAYAKLLFDPCGADLVEPPYIGVESGYMVRTRDVVIPYFLGAALPAGNYDFVVQWSPGNLAVQGTTTNYGLLSGGGNSSSSITLGAGSKQYSTSTLSAVSQSNFVNGTNSPVNSFRVVSCCVSFIPTGPPLTRQGVVSMITVPNAWSTAPGIFSGLATNIEEACPHVRTNGSESHEIVWLPSSKDQEYGTFENNTVDSGYGTVIVALANVDSSSAAAGPNNMITPNGRFEITTVWQWTPRINGGLIQQARAPPKHTVNDVLSEIRDIGEKVYTGVNKFAAGAMAVERLLTRF